VATNLDSSAFETANASLQKGAVGGVPVDRAVVARASLMTFSGSGSGEEGASRTVSSSGLRLSASSSKLRLKLARRSSNSLKAQEIFW